MKNKIFFLVGGILILGIIIYSLKGKTNPQNQSIKSNNPLNVVQNKTNTIGDDVCAEFTKEFIATIMNKPIVKTERFDTTGTHVCKYYLNDNDNFIIRLDALNVEDQKTGLKALGRSLTTNPKIKMNHFVAIQENGLINEVVLIINPNLFIAIDRSSTKAASETEIIDYSAKIAEKLGKGIERVISEPSPTIKKEVVVPLPQETDIVRNFFNLIEERKISDAVAMMNDSIMKDDSQKQAWGVQMNAMKSVKVIAIDPSMPEEWSDNKHTYKVTLDVIMDLSSASAPIPYYGYENGTNIRWITLEKSGNTWKVMGIATGP
jgi:hypothetical protein